jgi:hypothetical protein
MVLAPLIWIDLGQLVSPETPTTLAGKAIALGVTASRTAVRGIRAKSVSGTRTSKVDAVAASQISRAVILN